LKSRRWLKQDRDHVASRCRIPGGMVAGSGRWAAAEVLCEVRVWAAANYADSDGNLGAPPQQLIAFDDLRTRVTFVVVDMYWRSVGRLGQVVEADVLILDYFALRPIEVQAGIWSSEQPAASVYGIIPSDI
jgi:hypothetical protein